MGPERVGTIQAPLVLPHACAERRCGRAGFGCVSSASSRTSRKLGARGVAVCNDHIRSFTNLSWSSAVCEVSLSATQLVVLLIGLILHDNSIVVLGTALYEVSLVSATQQVVLLTVSGPSR